MSTATLNTPAGHAVTPELIMRYAWGFGPPLILDAAIHFRIFDHLDDGPKSVEQISAACIASERGIRSLLNALVGMALLTKRGDRYGLTLESSKFLVSNQPGFIGRLVQQQREHLLPQWLKLREIARTGVPKAGGNLDDDGEDFFQGFAADLFNINFPGAQALAKTLLDGVKTPYRALDLAAGSGVWGIALARQSPLVTVTAADWPKVTAVTRSFATRFAVADRFQYLEGDLQEVDLGAGYQAAILGHILHMQGADWNRELLRKTFDALEPGGTVAIGEWLVNDDRTGPLPALLFAVNMLIHTPQGDTYSFEEIAEWLTQAGFRHIRSLMPVGPFATLLADKPR